MKRLLYAAVFLVAISCKKELPDRSVCSNSTEETSNSARDPEPIPAPEYRWTNLPDALPPAPHNLNGNNIIMPVDGKVYCVTGSGFDRELFELNISTRTWAASNDFVFGEFTQYIFSHGTKVYQGLTINSTGSYAGMQSIDVNTGATASMAAFPGTIVTNFTSFVIGDKGYLMGGASGNNTVNQFWEYNFITNQWTNKGNSPLGKRAGAVAFVHENKAYFGGGYESVTLNGIPARVYKNDWLQYTPGSVFYAIKANIPGTKRQGATGFVTGSLIYVGFGYSSSALKDLWQYSTSSDSWRQVPSWPGSLTTINDFGGFSINTVGYIVKGSLGEFWNFRAGYFFP